MIIYVNNISVTLAEGMTVRHAITALASGPADTGCWIAHDQWGNRVGLDGTLRDGDKITAEMVVIRKCD